jgi:hypothetical protein
LAQTSELSSSAKELRDRTGDLIGIAQTSAGIGVEAMLEKHLHSELKFHKGIKVSKFNKFNLFEQTSPSLYFGNFVGLKFDYLTN